MAALLLLIPAAVLGYAIGWFARRVGRRVITIEVEPSVYDEIVVKYRAKYHHLDLMVYQTGRAWRVRIADSQLPANDRVEEKIYHSPEEAKYDAKAAAHAYLQEFYKDHSYASVPEAEIRWEAS